MIETVNDPMLNIAAGEVLETSVMSALGEWSNGLVNSAGEDCCRWSEVSGPPRLPTPNSAGEQMTLISDSAADNGTTSTGVLSVRIHYLDVSGEEQTEDVILNGTTAVNTVATDIIFINDLYSLTVGSNGVSEGNITLYKTGGAIATDLYNLIALGGNKSLVPHRMIPAGKTLYLMGWHGEEAQDKRCVIRIRSTDMYGVLIPGVFCFKGNTYVRKNTSGELNLHGTPIPSMSIVKVTHWDDALGTEGAVGWWGYLKTNI